MRNEKGEERSAPYLLQRKLRFSTWRTPNVCPPYPSGNRWVWRQSYSVHGGPRDWHSGRVVIPNRSSTSGALDLPESSNKSWGSRKSVPPFQTILSSRLVTVHVKRRPIPTRFAREVSVRSQLNRVKTKDDAVPSWLKLRFRVLVNTTGRGFTFKREMWYTDVSLLLSSPP